MAKTGNDTNAQGANVSKKTVYVVAKGLGVKNSKTGKTFREGEQVSDFSDEQVKYMLDNNLIVEAK